EEPRGGGPEGFELAPLARDRSDRDDVAAGQRHERDERRQRHPVGSAGPLPRVRHAAEPSPTRIGGSPKPVAYIYRRPPATDRARTALPCSGGNVWIGTG